MSLANYNRDGGNKIVQLAKALVVLVQRFSGLLIQKYGAESPIGLLIAAILALAPLIPEADAEVTEYGGNNAHLITDPLETPGIDPSAPPEFAPPDYGE